jgi:hypothetical protein
MNQNAITIKLTTVYGNETIYPVCEKANLLVSLTKKKTFDRRDIETIKALGYTVNIAQQTL